MSPVESPSATIEVLIFSLASELVEPGDFPRQTRGVDPARPRQLVESIGFFHVSGFNPFCGRDARRHIAPRIALSVPTIKDDPGGDSAARGHMPLIQSFTDLLVRRRLVANPTSVLIDQNTMRQ